MFSSVQLWHFMRRRVSFGTNLKFCNNSSLQFCGFHGHNRIQSASFQLRLPLQLDWFWFYPGSVMEEHIGAWWRHFMSARHISPVKSHTHTHSQNSVVCSMQSSGLRPGQCRRSKRFLQQSTVHHTIAIGSTLDRVTITVAINMGTLLMHRLLCPFLVLSSMFSFCWVTTMIRAASTSRKWKNFLKC